jgi:hypothetical protein
MFDAIASLAVAQNMRDLYRLVRRLLPLWGVHTGRMGCADASRDGTPLALWCTPSFVRLSLLVPGR